MINLTYKDCLIKSDASMSYLILDQYPLYNYADEKNDIHILCLGGGQFMRQMIMTIASCGQMIGYRLFIHVVANMEAECREKLLEAAPELRYYAQIDSLTVNPDHQYISLSFDQEKQLNSNAALTRVVKRYGHCSYVIVSLKDVNTSTTVAEQYARLLAKKRGSNRNPVIHYYSNSGNRVASDLKSTVTMVPFNSAFPKYRNKLGQMMAKAFRAHYMYSRIYNPVCKAEDALKDFGEYNQLSSFATAVHIRYKLKSIGIDPDRNHRSKEEAMERVAKQYQEKKQRNRRKLMELEHRRWIMFMISSGYTFPRDASCADVFCPDVKTMTRYFYTETTDGQYNGRFRYEASAPDKSLKHPLKLHPCLVPSSASSRRLPTDHGEWDRFHDYADIDCTEYDALDKVSLKLHLFARKRMEDTLYQARIGNIVENELSIILQNSFEDYPGLREAFISFSNAVNNAIIAKNTAGLSTAKDLFLTSCFRLDNDTLTHVNSAIKKIDNEFSIYNEFNRYHDYKEPDAGIVDHLLWVYCADEDLTLVKMYSEGNLSNIASYLTLEPRKLIVYGGPKTEADRKDFIERYESLKLVEKGALSVEPRRRKIEDATKEDITKDLLDLVRVRKCHRVLIDVTDTSGRYLAAAMSAAAKSNKIDVVLFDYDTSSVLDLTNHYPLVSIYTLKRKLDAEQVFSINGARTIDPKDQMDLSMLKEEIQKLWKLYLISNDPDSSFPYWNRICEFLQFFSSQKNYAEFYASLKREKLLNCENWIRVQKEISVNRIEASGLESILKQAEQSKLIRDWMIKKTDIQHATVSFNIPWFGPWIKSRFEFFLDNVGSEPLIFWGPNKTNPNTYLITSGKINSNGFPNYGSSVYIDRLGVKKEDANKEEKEKTDTKSEKKDEKFVEFERGVISLPTMKQSDFEEMRAFLNELDKEGLIYKYQCTPISVSQRISEDSVEYKISFKYMSPMLPRFFAKKGNLLEAYSWYQMVSSGVFDNIKPNLSFRWGSDISNDDELDVVATRDMAMMVVSCKMSNFLMEHIAAVKYLSERFSRVALPVIIYSPQKLFNEKTAAELSDIVRRRVADMGVFLIDGRILSSGKLNTAIKQIALGKLIPQDFVNPPVELIN